MEEKVKERLRARAKALAREPDNSEAAGEVLTVIEFQLASERYGLELRRVREVCSLKDLTPLPGTPPFALGIINVRGQILPVINLKTFFDLPQSQGLSDLNKAIIVHHADPAGDMTLGLLADAILGVRAVPLTQMQAAPATVSGIGAGYLQGVTPDRLIVLDLTAILSDTRLLVNEGGDE